MLKVAIIGLGTVSPIHIMAIQEMVEAGRVKFVGGCDIDPTRADKLPEGVPFYNNVADLLSEAKPDAVHTCLPHDLHGSIGRQVLEAGCHLFTEKPLCHTLADAENLVAFAAGHPEQVSAVCFQNRLNPCSVELKRRIDSGEDGAVIGIRAHVYWDRNAAYYEAEPWRGKIHRAGGGSLINQAIHTLDLMQYFVGSLPISLNAVTSQLGEIMPGVEVEDSAMARMDYPNGVYGFYTSTNVAGTNYPVEVMVQCEKANYFLRGTELLRECSDREDAVCVSRDHRFTGEKFYYGMSHSLMIQAFYDAIEGKDAPIVTLEEGLASLRMIDAIFRSSLSGRKVDV